MFIGSAQNTTLLPITTGAPEHYEPLWWYSGANCTEQTTASGSNWLPKGSTSPYSVSSTPAVNLLTLNSSWSVTTKFAFEASLQANSGQTVYAALWDITAGAIVNGSQISTTSTTFTVLRSGQFTLPRGHVLGITLWGTSGTANYITDASLIVFSS